LRSLGIVLAAVLVADAVATALATLRGPYPAFVPLGSPAAYVNLYVHVPVAISSYILYTGALVSAILYLVKRKPLYDRLVVGFVAVATVYAAYTLISGSLWAAESWGVAWNWDPRQTGVLLLFVAYLVYFALRASIADPDRAPVVSAVYAIAAYAMVPVSYAAPRIAESSLHPTQALVSEFMAVPLVRVLFYSKLALVAILGILAVYVASRMSLDRAYSRGLALAGALALIVLASTSAYMALAYLGGTVTRVYVAIPNPDGSLTLTVWLEGLTNITYRGPYDAFLVDGKVALGGHIVRLELANGEAVGLTILRPPCVILNVLLYGIMLAGLTYIVVRRATSSGG
jgi:hypothetical protein